MTNQIIADANGSFNSNRSFGPNLATSIPPSADDPRAIEWAEQWLHSEHAPEAAGNDRFPAAVAITLILRERGLSEPVAEDLCQGWNYVGCSPSLEWADISWAVRLVYANPVGALA